MKPMTKEAMEKCAWVQKPELYEIFVKSFDTTMATLEKKAAYNKEASIKLADIFFDSFQKTYNYLSEK